jgi:peptide deformylase
MIIKYPDPKLGVVCTTVKYDEARRIAKKLIDAWTLYQNQHKNFYVVGLAAPQIGIPKNVFIAFKEVFINPRIIEASTATIVSRECCCSLDGLYQINRPKSVTLIWTNISRQLQRRSFDDAMACVIEHECDHLRGIMLNNKGVIYERSD